MIKDLLASIDNNVVVSIYCDIENPIKHLTGFIGALDDNLVLINHISRDGYYDGYILIQLSDVHRVDVEGNYEIRLKQLYTIRNQKHDGRFIDQRNLCLPFFQFGKDKKLILSAEIDDYALTGFLIDYDAEYIKLLLVDEFGVLNGESIVEINEVRSFVMDSSTEQSIKLLYDYKRGVL